MRDSWGIRKGSLLNIDGDRGVIVGNWSVVDGKLEHHCRLPER